MRNVLYILSMQCSINSFILAHSHANRDVPALELYWNLIYGFQWIFGSLKGYFTLRAHAWLERNVQYSSWCYGNASTRKCLKKKRKPLKKNPISNFWSTNFPTYNYNIRSAPAVCFCIIWGFIGSVKTIFGPSAASGRI